MARSSESGKGSPATVPVTVTAYTTPPEALVGLLLRSHGPYALPLARRLRFTRLPGGLTEHSRILFSSAISLEEREEGAQTKTKGRMGGGGGPGGDEAGGGGGGGFIDYDHEPFAAAYVDLSRAPETEMWVYSSMERRIVGAKHEHEGVSENGTGKWDGKETEDERDARIEQQEIISAVELLREVKRVKDMYFSNPAPAPAPAQQDLVTLKRSEKKASSVRQTHTVLIGNLNEVLRKRLVSPDAGGMKIASTGLYDKWFFDVDELPDAVPPELLYPIGGTGEGKRWSWDIVREEDLGLTISRTNIQRKERTMKLLPSTALYLDDGTPIAWAFLGPDSSLSSLHCEEPYRGQGIAKAVAARALKQHLRSYVDDGQPYLGWADVAPDNSSSRGVCKSLGGHPKWQISWSHIDLELSFPTLDREAL
ncbi:hypothetical protein F5Y17DRAFT_222697 [Xylariaceae sp. FL0594]|nr:hypothetical protein F5Y17DRAFT_222697 [Xylariaceae sp. FL0594]